MSRCGSGGGRSRRGPEFELVSLLKHLSLLQRSYSSNPAAQLLVERAGLRRKSPAASHLYSSLFNRFKASSVRKFPARCNTNSLFGPSAFCPRLFLPHFVLHFRTGPVIHRTVSLASRAP